MDSPSSPASLIARSFLLRAPLRTGLPAQGAFISHGHPNNTTSVNNKNIPEEDPSPIILEKHKKPADINDCAKGVLPNRPIPLDSENNYGEDEIRTRLAYVTNLLQNHRRRISPMGVKALQLYKNACETLLQIEQRRVEGEQELEEFTSGWRAIFRNHDKATYYLKCLSLTATENATELQAAIISLKMTNFYARYGDIFAETYRGIKGLADTHKLLGEEALHGKYWTNIANNLFYEERFWFDILTRGKEVQENCPTHIAVMETCQRVGFNLEHMLKIIKHYARRNELMHSNLVKFIQEEKYHGLARLMDEDLTDIPLMFVSTTDTEMTVMRELVNSACDLFFNRPNPENHQTWTPTEYLIRQHKRLEGSNATEQAKANKEINRSIVDIVSKRLRKLENTQSLFNKVVTFNPLTGTTQKRVAPAEFDEQQRVVKRQATEWTKMCKIMENAQRAAENYAKSYGSLYSPPEIVIDPSMGE